MKKNICKEIIEEMKEARETAIQDQKKYGLDPKHFKSNSRTSLLNNFFCHFPHDKFSYRDLYDTNDFDEKIDEGSKLLRSQTSREFYFTLDTVIEECGINMKKLGKLIHLRTRGSDKENSEADSDISRMIFPVYVKMREKGYARDPDLVC